MRCKETITVLQFLGLKHLAYRTPVVLFDIEFSYKRPNRIQLHTEFRIHYFCKKHCFLS